ncbi:MAG: UDP-N-acetylmuramoyl-L-alanine--D-glutamate ligase [Desulfovibrionaceae bacterium]|nr:UDP-N-acetylmuramoyl-L-alanine--D-glutamate ligase [Desulfovibrionaceae bacterium]MBF0514463.1 UDP-N-acetylmuramoyl-L-alanine--D-glutamate ligase [Desulfovibrionaceae bacterium]
MRSPANHTGVKGLAAVVLGAGASGLAAARLLASRGARVRLLDVNPGAVDAALESELTALGIAVRLGEHTAEDFQGARLVAISPGIPAAKLAHLMPAGAELVSELELASRFTSEPILAITGTNGKTTTTMLASAILAAAGKKVFTGGNIGTPLSEHVLRGEKADALVLEVSSFQLQNISTFRPQAAALLNFSANHLDYHADMAEYLAAKLRLFVNQTPDDLAVAPEDMREVLSKTPFTRARTVYFAPRGRFEAPGLPGVHNQANMEAAYALCAHFGVDEKTAGQAMASFVPAGHRLERVGEKGGVLFIDDSKATTVEALRAAIESCDRPVRLLAGGVFKGGDLEGLTPLLRARVKSAGLFGASREIFEAAWAGALPLFWEPTLEGAVKRLYGQAKPGETMLLSPATASFDLYSGYKARGDDFKRIFRELPERAGEDKR